MWRFIKVILFLAYIGYAFKFMDDSAREGGIIDALLSLIVAGLFGYGVYHFLWIYDVDENKSEDQLSKDSSKLSEFNNREAQTLYEVDIAQYVESFKDFYLIADEEYQIILFRMKEERNLANLNIVEAMERAEDINKVNREAMEFLVKHRLQNGILKYDELKTEVQKETKAKLASILQLRKSIV